jgi:hypothetical protein
LQIARLHCRHRLVEEGGEHTVYSATTLGPTLQPIPLLAGVQIKQCGQGADAVTSLVSYRPLSLSLCYWINTPAYI